MENRFISLALILSMALSTGCASIIGQSKYAVPINSTPPGATVDITDENGRQVFSGTTPATAILRSGEPYFDRQSYIVTVKKDGFNPQTTTLRGEINGWYWGNLLIGGLVGMLIVDPLTGSMYELDTQSVNLALPSAGPMVAQSAQIPTTGSAAPNVEIAQSNKPVAELLRDLKRLRDEGVLTEEEYKSKKKDALARI